MRGLWSELWSAGGLHHVVKIVVVVMGFIVRFIMVVTVDKVVQVVAHGFHNSV